MFRFLALFLIALPLPGGMVAMTWNDNSADEDGFVIERAIGAGPWTEVARVPADTVEWEDREVPAGQIRWRVAAFNSSGMSGWSNELVLTPGSPTGARIEIRVTEPGS